MNHTQPVEDINTLEALANKLKRDIEARENTIVVFDADIARIRKVVVAENYTVGELIKQKETLESQVTKLSDKKETLDKEIADLNNQQTNLQSENNDLEKSIKAQIADLNTKIEEFKEINDRANKESDKLSILRSELDAERLAIDNEKLVLTTKIAKLTDALK